MRSAEILDIVERLHTTAEHPDIVQIRRSGRDAEPGGQSPPRVVLRYQSAAESYFTAAEAGRPGPEPWELPEQMPARKFRAQPALRFLVQLLDTARPAQFQAWRVVQFPTAVPGLEIRCADGTTAYLRVTSGSGPMPEPDEDPYAGYVIPEGVGAG